MLSTLKFQVRHVHWQIKNDHPAYFLNYVKFRRQTLEKHWGQKFIDLIVVIHWNTDNTDVDLHVKEPSGETCYYNNSRTSYGGLLSEDITRGYGPEIYTLKKAPKGKYQIKVKYFAANVNRVSTRTVVYATIYQNWGKANERITKKVLLLKKNKEMHNIFTVKID